MGILFPFNFKFTVLFNKVLIYFIIYNFTNIFKMLRVCAEEDNV